VTNLAPVALWRPPGELRRQLIEMRADMLDRMLRRGAAEPGHLPLIAGINAALEALDRSARTEAAAPAVVDGSGTAIRLVLYRDGAAIAATEIEATTAIALAGELLGAAGMRLADDLAELRRRPPGERVRWPLPVVRASLPGSPRRLSSTVLHGPMQDRVLVRTAPVGRACCCCRRPDCRSH
jgi:hypothetical protein